MTNRFLGYPEDARLLIINADDFGMCHAVNEAIIGTLRAGVVRSTTLMTPCPWALHAMHYLAEHPEVSFGVHLTAISEWPEYRWGPVTSKNQVPSLVDSAGYFYRFERMQELLAQIDLAQLEREFRAQIEVVLAAGLKPDHLDWHALRIGGRPDIQDLLVGLAKEYGLALRVMGRGVIDKIQGLGLPTIDNDFLDSYLLDPAQKPALYTRLLHELPPGLSEWAVHPALNCSELRAIEPGDQSIRQADFDFFTSPQAKATIQAEGITLIDYRALQPFWKNPA
jgi:predicted glycoside hydrolase/deacetylase ChbG (UPF0249 family)